MKILISYYIPSGGMETLNRLRSEILRRHGIVCHLHYYHYGSGLQNQSGATPTFITDSESELQHLLMTQQYDAVIVSHDYATLERVRRLGYRGIVLYEVQGLGTREQAIRTLTEAAPYIRSFSTAVFYPRTSHLVELFSTLFPDVGQFIFSNLLDIESFGYRPIPVRPFPVIGWVGRFEANKNWRDFMEIGLRLRERMPNLQLWMFHDPALVQPEEAAAFERMLSDNRMESYLTLHGNVPHSVMADYFSIIGDSGGFLASTSILEGFGYAVAEAMLCRCPVLSTDSDGVRSFISHDVTGKFYPLRHIDAAIAQALELMCDASLRERIRENGRAHIAAHFSPAQYVAQFLEMFRALGLA